METARGAAPTYSSSAVRPGPVGLVREAVGELRSRRQLVRYLVQADLKKKGADSLLGNLWWVLDPLLQMLVYVILVAVIFQRQQEAYPLFIFAAILPWKWFTSSIGDAITSVSSQDRLIKQVHFPKLVLPTAAQASGVANFAFGLIPLLTLMVIFYPHKLSLTLLYVPLIAIVQLVFTAALGFVLSAVNVFYRDVGNLSRHVLRLWFYLSPGLYGAATMASLGDKHPELYGLMQLNPFFILFSAYRQVIYGTETPSGGSLPPAAPDWASLGVLLVVSLVLLFVATIFFKRIEPTFAKVL
ncbi:MAG: ABC transporter permease [Chloroflexota bacterium]|nr:ABC transporter permease [Chloroflexota bacterium]